MENFSLEQYLKYLQYLVNFDNGSMNAKGVARVADFFKEKFEEGPWKCELIKIEGAPVGPCLKVSNTPDDDYDVLLLGHMDTALPDGEAEKRPYTIDENGIVRGVGVSDMKGCLLSTYFALAELSNEHRLDHAKVCFLLNCDEETGSRYSGPTLRKIAKHAKHVIVVEAARKTGDMVKERSGVADYHLHATGVSAHAGVNPQDGSSAINELAEWIVRLHKLSNYAVGTSVNVGIIKGGKGSNVVAPEADADVDVRFKTQAEFDRVNNAIRELEKQSFTPGGAKVTAEYRPNRPPMPCTEKTQKLADLISKLGKEQGLSFGWVATGGGSDGNITADMGIPTVDGVGPVGAGGHSAAEWLDSKSVEPRMRLLKSTIAYLCDHPDF